MTDFIRFGGVYLAQLEPSKGMEVGKKRPCVVMQSDTLNACGIKTFMVMPLSSQYRKELEAIRVKISAREDLLQDSCVLIEHIRSISLSRIHPRKIAQLTSAELNEIKFKLNQAMG